MKTTKKKQFVVSGISFLGDVNLSNITVLASSVKIDKIGNGGGGG
jgi:hypothetical protein